MEESDIKRKQKLGEEISGQRLIMKKILKDLNDKTQYVDDKAARIKELIFRNNRQATFPKLLQSYQKKMINQKDDPSVFKEISGLQ